MKLKAAVFAYSEIGSACLEELLRQGADVACVVTHPDDPKEEIWFRSVAKIAKERKIPVLEADSAIGPEWAGRISRFAPDVIFSFMFRLMLPEEVLKCAGKAAFNLHPSLLPKYRGRAPANWAIVNGETETGLTLHEMVKKADAGAIVCQTKVAIGPDDTIADLNRKLAEAAPLLMREILPKIADGTYPRTEQDDSKATKFGRRGPADGMFCWDWPASKIHNLVRAVTHPYPGAFFQAGKRKIFVWKTAVGGGPVPPGLPPGRVVGVSPFAVVTGQGALEIISLQPEGEAELGAGDFARKYAIAAGDYVHGNCDAKSEVQRRTT